MLNSYADIHANLSEVLQGAARLHIALGRMDEAPITTRGWTYNELVAGIVAFSSEGIDPAVRQWRCLGTLFDTLEAMEEIGANAVHYFSGLQALVEGK